MTDDMLRAVANSGGPESKGGVVQVNFYSAFISQAYRDAQKAQKPEVDKAVQELKDKAKAEGKEVTYEEISKVRATVCRPNSAAAALGADRSYRPHRQGGRGGPRGAGLGFRWRGRAVAARESTPPADLPKITAALMERGYSAEDCRKILGGNLLRVFREVQAVAKELQAENRPRITEKQPFEKQ